MKPLKRIKLGTWATKAVTADEERRPWPGDWIDWEVDKKRRRALITYLKGEHFSIPEGGKELRRHKCRLCRQVFRDYDVFHDGTYEWPSYLIHYITKHRVMLPKDVVDAMLSGRKSKPMVLEIDLTTEEMTSVIQMASVMGVKPADYAKNVLLAHLMAGRSK